MWFLVAAPRAGAAREAVAVQNRPGNAIPDQKNAHTCRKVKNVYIYIKKKKALILFIAQRREDLN